MACSGDPEAEGRRFAERGDQFVAAGSLPEALIEYRNALQQLPLDGAIREKVADTALRLGDTTAALAEYVRAADLMPENVAVQVKAASLLLLANKFEDARSRAAKVLAINPAHVEANLVQAQALIGLKDVESAVAQIEEAIRANPDRGEIYTNLGAIELERGQRDAAEAAFTKAVELAPDSLQAQLAAGNFYWLVGENAKAEPYLTKALQLAPRDFLANRTLANYYLSIGRMNEAEAPLKVMAESKQATHGLALAEYYVLRGRADDARAILEPLASDREFGNEAQVRLATLDYRLGRRPAAHQRLDTLIAANPRLVSALLVKARLLQAERKFQDALTAARTVTSTSPNSTAGFILVGQLENQLGRPREAIAAFEEALRLNPRASDARLALATLRLAGGHADTSASLARDVLRGAPANPDARLALARALIAKNDLAGAERELTLLAIRYSRVAAVQSELGMVSGRQGRAAAARQYFERALSLEPDHGQALLGLIALDLSENRLASARSRVESVLKQNPTPAGLVLAARTLAATGERQRAEALLRSAIDKDSAYLPAYIALGNFYISENRLPAARAEFEALANRTPEPVVPLTMVGVLQQAEGNAAGARQTFERVLQLRADAPVAANNLAYMLAEANTELGRALELAETAKRGLPDNPSVNHTLGFVLLLHERAGQAIPPLRESVAAAPENPLYHYHLGKAYFSDGEMANAKASLSEALRLNSTFRGSDDARQLLQKIGR